jgi:hypothetical protein
MRFSLRSEQANGVGDCPLPITKRRPPASWVVFPERGLSRFSVSDFLKHGEGAKCRQRESGAREGHWENGETADFHQES